MSKQISTEWKNIDESIVPLLEKHHTRSWKLYIQIPTAMDVEFSMYGKSIKHPYTHNCISYDNKEYVWEWENGKKVFKTFEVDPYFRIWDGNDWAKHSPEIVYENIQVRPNIKQAKIYNQYIDDLKIGDFVKFVGQRNPNIWKKIVNIHENTLTCIQYYRPIDDNSYMQANATDTFIWKIKEKFNDN